MFRSLDHPQGATLFLAKVTSKTFIKFLYINRVLWQHVVLCKIALLGKRPGYGVRRVLRGERPRNLLVDKVHLRSKRHIHTDKTCCNIY